MILPRAFKLTSLFPSARWACPSPNQSGLFPRLNTDPLWSPSWLLLGIHLTGEFPLIVYSSHPYSPCKWTVGTQGVWRVSPSSPCREEGRSVNPLGRTMWLSPGVHKAVASDLIKLSQFFSLLFSLLISRYLC